MIHLAFWLDLSGRALMLVALILLGVAQVRLHRRLLQVEARAAKFLEMVNALEWMHVVAQLTGREPDEEPQEEPTRQ